MAPVIGTEINRSLVRDKPDGPLWYAQTHAVDGKELPIFGHGTTLHVAKSGRVTSVTNNVVPPEQLNVTGDVDAVDVDAVKDDICKQLGICKETLTGVREGIYLIDDNPDKGRVVLRFGIASGDEQRDVEVFFDEKTKTIVDIR